MRICDRRVATAIRRAAILRAQREAPATGTPSCGCPCSTVFALGILATNLAPRDVCAHLPLPLRLRRSLDAVLQEAASLSSDTW